MDLIDCKKKQLVKEITPDNNLINSLVKSSDNKLVVQGLLELNDITAASKICLLYDALRELLEALAIKKGYKIYNHECFTYFLKEVMSESSLADSFDELRKLRNAINYYGKSVNANESFEVLNELKRLIEKTKKVFKR